MFIQMHIGINIVRGNVYFSTFFVILYTSSAFIYTQCFHKPAKTGLKKKLVVEKHSHPTKSDTKYPTLVLCYKATVDDYSFKTNGNLPFPAMWFNFSHFLFTKTNMTEYLQYFSTLYRKLDAVLSTDVSINPVLLLDFLYSALYCTISAQLNYISAEKAFIYFIVYTIC